MSRFPPEIERLIGRSRARVIQQPAIAETSAGRARAGARVALAERVAPPVLSALGATWRFAFSGTEHLRAARERSPDGRVIYCCWHGTLLPLMYVVRDSGLRALVSRHRDGEIVARVGQRLGLTAVRGSTTRGGARALIAAIRDGGRGDLALTPDGPRGPSRRFHAGAVLLAARTGLPIVPVGCAADRVWRARSWDGFQVPHPFARVQVVCGPPLFVPRGGAGREDHRALAERALASASAEAERRAGSRRPAPPRRDAAWDRAYWERATPSIGGAPGGDLWRAHSDGVNGALLGRWLAAPSGRVLKTDLFDEAAGDGLVEPLRRLGWRVVGMDLSGATAALARGRSGPPAASADVRSLPFSEGAFDAVVSISTLDHLGTWAEILAALAELRRVLRPGGQLVITLDNAANPAVALRNALPFQLLNRLGLVPFRVGATSSAARLCGALRVLRFDILDVTAVLHCPRVLAVPLAQAVARRCRPAGRRRLLTALGAFERMAAWPTRWWTGHFVAALALKPRDPA